MAIINEINEQPDVLQRLLDTRFTNIQSAAKMIQKRDIRSVFLAARGSSDNAGLYAKYLFAINNRLPVALAAPSTFSIYKHPPDLKDALILGISQSGQSPDMVSVIEEGKKQGCLTIAITNDLEAPLAKASELVIDMNTGPEKAVAATKTYTAQLMILAMLSSLLKNDQAMINSLWKIPPYIQQAIELNTQISQTVERFAYIDACVILGRGYNYATVYEWALKLKELTYISAEPYSSADFLHGPVAILEPRFPVFTILPDGVVFNGLLELLEKLVAKHKIELLVISNREEALRLANTSIRMPIGLEEWLSPIVAIVPAQLFCYHLTKIKGIDPDSPRGLQKITETT